MSRFTHQGEKKKIYVENMFDDISARYDLFNTISSFGIDRYWRKKLTNKFNLNQSSYLIDIATGTGDVLFSMHKKFGMRAIGIDISGKMIKLATLKRDKRNISEDIISFARGDAEKLELSDDSYDALTISFGFRNLGDYDKGLAEFYRVLKKKGKIAILEFSKPTSIIFSPLFRFYFNKVVPLIGALLSRKDAFLYLPESVDFFLNKEDVCSKMRAAGFENIKFKDYTFGVVTIYTAEKI